MFFDYADSPIGRLYMAATEQGLCRLTLAQAYPDNHSEGCKRAPCQFVTLKKQLDEYFFAGRTEFTLQLAIQGTVFQQAVWQALREIPYGETRSYTDIAVAIGKPKACRAVGLANNANPILLINPCHRVIGRNGNLTGFRCGLGVKQQLLHLEQGVSLTA